MCHKTLIVYRCDHPLPGDKASKLDPCAKAEYTGEPCADEETKLYLVRHVTDSCQKCNPFQYLFNKEGKAFVDGEYWDMQSLGMRRNREYLRLKEEEEEEKKKKKKKKKKKGAEADEEGEQDEMTDDTSQKTEMEHHKYDEDDDDDDDDDDDEMSQSTEAEKNKDSDDDVFKD
ncbi:hypothetical protein K504DRAFT_450680 [Pleomassaria siparia CBS 279.74]|uniref:Uncharacterized protein n=1 Tax=Pleomassaria siparia CBS 279.74 TaxID=1314801 RepID=A0A6G1KMG8_9PLEO|nr:hypothetical protein K504DRAFT_450680 [Pleomassaria siparia CBS 279.74]